MKMYTYYNLEILDGFEKIFFLLTTIFSMKRGIGSYIYLKLHNNFLSDL